MFHHGFSRGKLKNAHTLQPYKQQQGMTLVSVAASWKFEIKKIQASP
jgi:hypothetical protein